MYHTGLAMGSPEDGVLQSFSLDTKILSDGVVSDPKTGTSARFVNLLRPTGRTVTFQFPSGSSVGKPVGVDANNANAYTLYKIGGEYDLIFTEGATRPEEYIIHHFNSDGDLSGVGYGPSWAEANKTEGTPGSWPGLSWSSPPLSEMETPWYDVDFIWTEDKVTQVAFANKDTAEEIVRINTGYGSPPITSVTKEIKNNGQWIQVDAVNFLQSTNGEWCVDRFGYKEDQVNILSTNTGNHLVKIIRSQTGQTDRVSFTLYTNAPWGQVIIEEGEYDPDNPGPNDRSTIYTYYTNLVGALSNQYGRLKSEATPDGFWTRYTYSTNGLVSEEWNQFLDAPITAASNEARRIVYEYMPVDSGDDGTRAPETPRTTVEYLLGQEVRRSYTVILSNETHSIQCVTPRAAYSDTNNLVTITRTYGAGSHQGRTKSISHPNGTMTLYDYVTSSNQLTTHVYSGEPNGSETAILDGTQTSTTIDEAGRTLVAETRDIATGILISRQITSNPDSFGRFQTTDYLDGTSAEKEYGCCGIDSSTDKNGTATTYLYDDFKRLEYRTTAGITEQYQYDFDGNTTNTVRQIISGGPIRLSSQTYNGKGEQISSVDALDNETLYDRTYDTNGHLIATTTHPDLSTRIERYAPDGSLMEISGTAANPIKYEYGVDTNGVYSKEIRVGDSGEETEWTKTYTDLAGRTILTVFADGAEQQQHYNGLGQLIKTVDPDGVTLLYTYNAQGDQEVRAVDLNQNDQIDFSGTDRISQTLSDVITSNSLTRQRTQVYRWDLNGQSQKTLIQESQRSLTTRESWAIQFGLMTHTLVISDSAGEKITTTTAPDGTFTTREEQDGNLQAVTFYDPASNQVRRTTYNYDGHGRRHRMIDARNGTTIYWYTTADQISSITAPAPTNGAATPITSYTYDERGRVSTVTDPANGVISNQYYATGQLQESSGARTYPIAYTYDNQGRLITMTTWQHYATGDEEHTTQWSYHSQRGWLTEKSDANGNDVDYSYTAAGRLARRTSARDLITSNTYNQAGQLTDIDYSDSTPSVDYFYDRVGRIQSITDASGSRDIQYNNVSQPTTIEYTDGPLTEWLLYPSYNSLHRQDFLTVEAFGTSVYSNHYQYGNDARLQSVSRDTHHMSYGYEPDSTEDH